MKKKHANHEQSFTKSTTTLPQNIVWAKCDDVTEGENERVDVFHVKVVGRDCVGYGVLGKSLGLFRCIPGDRFRGKNGGGTRLDPERTESLTLGQVPEGCNRALPLLQPSNLDCLAEDTSPF